MKVNYKTSLFPSKKATRWNINKEKGDITIYVTNIWNNSKDFDDFVEGCIFFTLVERICIERAYNKIKIKGGHCNPCCVRETAIKIYRNL